MITTTPANEKFSDIEKKYQEWYQKTYSPDNQKGTHVKLPEEPTVEGLEKEIWVKANLLADGLKFDASALEGVCDLYKEQSRWLFDWNIGEHAYYLPEELLLPMGTLVQVRENRDSRWLCTAEGGLLVLKRDGEVVIECRHIPRPDYYSQEASPGVIMRRIANFRGQDCLCINYAPYCMYWKNDQGCRFCNIVPNMRWTKDDLQVSRRSYEQIVNTTRVAFEEGCVRHILLTGGMIDQHVDKDGNTVDREDKMILDVIQAQQEALQRDDIPVNVIRTAPKDKDLKSIEEHKKKGVYSVAYNLEIWDPTLFEFYCPGKDNLQGRDHWLRALEVAAEVYGPGRVSTHFVTGFMEPESSLLEGVEWCAERGISAIPLIWSPVEGTRYAKFRAPNADWFVEMAKKMVDIRLKYNLGAFEPAASPNDCYMCAMPHVLADELRLRELQRSS